MQKQKETKKRASMEFNMVDGVVMEEPELTQRQLKLGNTEKLKKKGTMMKLKNSQASINEEPNEDRHLRASYEFTSPESKPHPLRKSGSIIS